MVNVFTIPASAPFAETLARGLIARTGAQRDPLALANVALYLPTRRAARSLNDTFARLLGGAALLPNLRPLGDIDEEEFLFDASTDALTLPPAIPPIRRVLLLATLVQRWEKRRRGAALPFAQAVALARGLADFLDEVETQDANPGDLDALAPDGFARHWADVKAFLEILRGEWPNLLAVEGKINPAVRRNLALRSLAKRLTEHPRPGLTVAAGSTGSIPATAELLGAIARLSNGFVVLPGLDKKMDEASWADLDAGHPQFGLKQLLRRIGVERADVADFGAAAHSPTREALLREAMRPAPTTDAWRAIADRGGDRIAEGIEGLSLVEAAHPGEEAAAIALMLREALEPPRRTAALVTPDRMLARRVASEMGRWNIAIDDSGGRPLANAPPGTFLCLLAEAAAEKFAPAPLLALLKHPLACGGQASTDFRRRVRQLDRYCLRGPRPDPGLSGARTAIAAAMHDAQAHERPYAVERLSELVYWFKSVAAILQPIEDAFARNTVALDSLLNAHTAVAEALAATDSEAGEARLWRGDAGDAAARLVAEIVEAAAGLPPIEPDSYPPLFRALAEEPKVRPVYGQHPRLAILGPLEARLQSFDLVILGGLNEGVWPGAAGVDPWLSRPMRAKLGLEPPERRIGLAAHDFATLASAPRVILTRSLKADGAPTVASRWLQRMLQLTKGLGLEADLESTTPYAAFAAMRDGSGEPPQRMERPRPHPPVAARPRRLSVTEIETWLRDPFAIYAKHVLRLRPLDPIDAGIGPLERGRAVHEALERFLKEADETLEDGAELRLIAIADKIFAAEKLPKSALALWRPRFLHAARWFVNEERVRRVCISGSHLEIRGERAFDGPAGEFILRGRADRIDVLKSGGAAIVDYKTGALPSVRQVKTLLCPQLPLEGAILASGGFAEAGKLDARALIYIRFGGGAQPGEIRQIPDVADLVATAETKLRDHIARFDDESTPYDSRLIPYRADVAGDYDHLARVREWSLTGWEELEE